MITHWHTDHIAGSAQILRNCPNAVLSISFALRTKELTQLILRFRQVPIKDNGIRELDELLLEMARRKKCNLPKSQIVLAGEGTRLYTSPDSYPVSVYSLSPSAEATTSCLAKFADFLMPEEGRVVGRLPDIRPNNTSVVLRIEFGERCFILGADLEDKNSPATGWDRIVECHLNDGKAITEYYKVPHHGSSNAHNSNIWSNIMISDAIATLTPYKAGKKPLPAPEDVARLKSLSSNVYQTSITTLKPVVRSGVIQKEIKAVTKSIRRVHGNYGYVRSRSHRNQPEMWEIGLYGAASAL